MQIKRLTITPIGLQRQTEIYKNLNPNEASNLIKDRLYRANGYDTKIPKCALIRIIGKRLQKKYDIDPSTLVMPSHRFIYEM